MFYTEHHQVFEKPADFMPESTHNGRKIYRLRYKMRIVSAYITIVYLIMTMILPIKYTEHHLFSKNLADYHD